MIPEFRLWVRVNGVQYANQGPSGPWLQTGGWLRNAATLRCLALATEVTSVVGRPRDWGC